MLSSSRGLRLALVLSVGFGVAALAERPAYAQDDEDEDEGGGGDDDEGGDEGGGPDEGDEEEEEDPKDQPPVTAGGLFTLKSYPVREISRPLTMTEKILQVRL